MKNHFGSKRILSQFIQHGQQEPRSASAKARVFFPSVDYKLSHFKCA